MPTLHDNYDHRVACRKIKIAKWRAKYTALGLSKNEIERIINKRIYRR